MAFLSFVGRVLFVSVFILAAWQELIIMTSSSVEDEYRVPCPTLILMIAIMIGFNEFGVDGGPAARALKPKINVLSKVVSSRAGLKLPVVEMKHLVAATIVLKGAGSLLFILDSSLGAHLLLLHQALATPVLYDFYNYDTDRKEYAQLFIKFTQNLAFLGALLFFVGMKNSIPKRSPKKKAPKLKAG